MCVLNKCCFCVPLKTGALIIGIVCIILAVLDIINAHTLLKSDSSIVPIALTVLAILFLIASIILVVAAVKNNPPWAIVWLIVDLIAIIIGIVILIMAVMNKEKLESIVFPVLFLLLKIYFLVCVYSYYKQGDVE